MAKNNYNIITVAKSFLKVLSVVIFLTFIYFIGAMGSVYLFDSTIIYEYGYLISKSYQPFLDFSTPLLPLAGYFQFLAYKCFGINYFSGIYAAFFFVLLQFATLFYLLIKITKNFNTSISISLIISITGIPLISNFYYNHLLISIVSVLFILMYFEAKVYSNKITFLIKFISLTMLIMIKIHWGICILIFQFIYDLTIKKKAKILKEYFLGFILIVVLSFIILYISNSSSLSNYFSYTSKLSIVSNINYDGLVKLLFNYPKKIISSIEINPVLLFLIITIPIFINKKFSLIKIKTELFLIIQIVAFSIFITINSTESNTIYLPLQIIILFLNLQYIENEFTSIEGYRLKILIIIFLILHFFYAILCVINGNRKLYNELSGEFTNMPYVPRLFSKKHYEPKSQKVKTFFKGVSLSENQVASFNFVDSIINQQPTKKIFFGPELEILNIIYDIKPPKGFPLWIHPGLTILDVDITKLEKLLFNNSPDLIFISKKRSNFLPFLSNENMINRNYQKIEISNSYNFVDCYIRNIN
jgi:hypothetical protein